MPNDPEDISLRNISFKIMIDWEILQDKAKKDIKCALDVWTELLNDIPGTHIEYAYVKGSSIKNWENPIDYVPIFSDVDVHVRLNEGHDIISSSQNAFQFALHMTKRYEELFKTKRSDSLHLPRMQIISVNQLQDSDAIEYVPPVISNVYMIKGTPTQPPLPTIDTVRRIDAKQMLKQEDYILTLPNRLFDRSGLDFWGILRCGGLSWRVSPSPFRVLTQLESDPYEVWDMNRTRICDRLEHHGYHEISEIYSSFYMNCWKLFMADIRDMDIFRNIIEDGYNILRYCVDAIKQI